MGITAKEVEMLRNDKLGPKLVEKFKARYFDAWYFSNREDALKHLESIVPEDHVVSWGGSLTMEALGVQQMMREKRKVIDRDSAKTPEERQELMRMALTSDTFIAGVNAISESGELVQVDWAGNRVAAMIYGPKQVIVIAGMNKVRKTLDIALARARTIASPANMGRFPDRTTGCSATGSCSDCMTPDCLCTYVVTVRKSTPKGRIKIILINESLGL